MKRLFYFATEREAAATRHMLGAHRCIAPGLYSCSQGYVQVGGMGSLLAAIVSAACSVHWEEIWNFGIAASLSTDYPLETRVIVGSVSRPNWFPEGLESRSKEWYHRLAPTVRCVDQKLGVARLVSCDFPIHQPHLADQLRASADLIDMEGYGLGLMAYQLAKPCFIGKWVTDSANVEGPLEIQRLLDQSSKHFSDWINELLKNPPINSIWTT